MTFLNRLAVWMLLIAAVAMPQAARAQALEKIRMTIPVPAMVFYPLYVAQDRGFFAKQGLDVELVVTQGDGPDVDAVIAGSVQFATSTPNRLLTAAAQGKPLKAVMDVHDRMALNCFINKESAAKAGIAPGMPYEEKMKRLKGLTLAGTRPGSFAYDLEIDMIQRAGLTPQIDTKVVSVGGPPAMIAAVENKAVDAACIATPTVEIAVSRGKAEWLVDNSHGEDPAFKTILFELVYVRPDYAAQHGDIVRKLLRAILDANAWIMHASDADNLAMLKPRFGTLDDKTLLESVANVKLGIVPDGCITRDSVDTAAAFLKRTGALTSDVPWTSVADNSFLPTACP